MTKERKQEETARAMEALRAIEIRALQSGAFDVLQAVVVVQNSILRLYGQPNYKFDHDYVKNRKLKTDATK